MRVRHLEFDSVEYQKWVDAQHNYELHVSRTCIYYGECYLKSNTSWRGV